LDHGDSAKLLLITNTYRCGGKTSRRLFAFSDFNSEGEMIDAWCNWVREKNPSIITGHNIFGYDLPYLQFIANRANTSLKLGRNGSDVHIEAKFTAKFRVDGSRDIEYKKCRVHGREFIDTMFLAYRYDTVAKKYESYGLKPIIKVEGLEDANRVFYDAGLIRKNYMIPEEWEKIKAYGEFDADDALKLFDLMAPPYFYMTQSCTRSFQHLHESAPGALIDGVMKRSYLQDGHSLPKASAVDKFEGAISIGNPGIYNNVFKIDVASLYPSIMIQYEVCDKEKDPNEYFKKLVRTFTDLRLEYKKKAKEDKYFDDLQNSFKIFINSCYGFLSTNGLLFNSPVNAAFITATGRDILQKAIAWAKSKECVIVNADTDSISFAFKDGREIDQPSRKALVQEINALYPTRIRFEDDGYFPKVIVLKAKNYVLYDGKKVKIKGSALKVTQKEPALREFINTMIDKMLVDQTDYKELYETYVTEVMNLTDIKRWSSRKTISNTTMTSERTNETSIMDAIAGTAYGEGDRIFVYYDIDGKTLKLAEKFDGNYCRKRLLKKLYDNAQVFETVLPVEELFPNYALVKKYKLLAERYENVPSWKHTG
jgi:DNA polymerase elongation subunit (family B)